MVMVEKTDMTAEMDQADKTVQVERLKTLPAADGFHIPAPGPMGQRMPEKPLQKSQRL